MKDLLKKATLAMVMAGLLCGPVVSNAAQGSGNTAPGLGQYLIDVDGDGVGDVAPQPGTGKGRNAKGFIDNNNNGICDTYESGGGNRQNQYGPKMQRNSKSDLPKGMMSKNGQGNGKGIRQQKKDGSCQVSMSSDWIMFSATKQQQRKKDMSCRV